MPPVSAAPAPRAEVVDALAALRRPGELWLLAALAASYGLVHALASPELTQAMNRAGPVALAAILGWAGYRAVRRSPIAIWAPLFWFRIACSAYFGFGALVPHIANEATAETILSLHAFDGDLNLKVNAIHTTGILCALSVAFLVLHYVRPVRPSRSAAPAAGAQPRTLFFALCFLLIGGGLRYGVVLPYELGLGDEVVAGALGALAKLFYAGLYLLIVHGLSRSRWALAAAALLVGIEIAVSIASFSKTDLLLVLMFSCLGLVSRSTNGTVLLAGAGGVLLAFFAFQPLVGYGREQITTRYGEIRGAGLPERWRIVGDYLDGARATAEPSRQDALSRLSYVNVAAFVVERYDAGAPGDTFRDAAAVLIPRALWPDKPIITQLGADLDALVFDREGSQLGVGHFAEAYWNFGWPGVLLLPAVLALILSGFTVASLRIMARRDWLLLPVVLMGVNLGLRVDGHFVPDILGAGWIALCLGLALIAARWLVRLWLPRRARPVAVAAHAVAAR